MSLAARLDDLPGLLHSGTNAAFKQKYAWDNFINNKYPDVGQAMLTYEYVGDMTRGPQTAKQHVNIGI